MNINEENLKLCRDCKYLFGSEQCFSFATCYNYFTILKQLQVQQLIENPIDPPNKFLSDEVIEQLNEIRNQKSECEQKEKFCSNCLYCKNHYEDVYLCKKHSFYIYDDLVRIVSCNEFKYNFKI